MRQGRASGQGGAQWPLLLALTYCVGHLAGTALAQVQQTADNNNNNQDPDTALAQSCEDCRLTSQSIDELTRKPRQVDAYGQVGELVDLDKIRKAVCKELASDRERDSCRSFFFGHPDAVERWRQQHRTASGAPAKRLVSFYDSVCIRDLKLCCPSASYGPKCTKCARCATPNEHCHGEGTRTGNGTCVCKAGHSGRNCATCLPGFYHDKGALALPETSAKRLLCKPCHRSCRYCRAPGPEGCEVCARGFAWVPGFGCSDEDECIKSDNKICGPNTFCVNTLGSYFCYECDRACNGCHGDGPDMCLRCAKNYKLENGNCVAARKTILPPEANYYRYAIYAGLCLSTCIIFHNSVYLASLVGLGVALYIGASEYVMSGNPGLAANPTAGAEMAGGGGNLAAGLSASPAFSHLGL